MLAPIRHQGKILIRDFPMLNRSILQQDIKHLVGIADTCILMYSRRIGKTTECAYDFFTNAVPDLDLDVDNNGFYDKYGEPTAKLLAKPLRRDGDVFMCAHPLAGDLHSRFYSGDNAAMAAPFGGKNGLSGGSLDDVYVKLPKRYYDYLFTPEGSINPNLDEAELEWWFGDDKKKIPSIIEVPAIPELQGEVFVKLFKENIGSSKSSKQQEGLCRGQFFNGLGVELIPANHFFAKYTRGKAPSYLWAEELGEWAEDYIAQDVIQAIIQKGGKVVATMTPAKAEGTDPKEHWTYKKYIENFVNLPSVVRKDYHGVNIYISQRKEEVYSSKVINGKETFVPETVSSTNILAIGKYLDCYRFGHDSAAIRQKVLNDLEEIVRVETMLDDQGKPLLNKDGKPVEKVIYTGEKSPGTMSMEIWHREYLMSYEGKNQATVFTNFGEHNILPSEYKEKFAQYPSIAGFDKGSAMVDEINQVILDKGLSATMIVDIAKIGDNQWVVYDEELMLFDKHTTVPNTWLKRASKGIPVVYDAKIASGNDYVGSRRNDEVQEIIKASPKLAFNYAGGIYYKCIIPSKKTAEIERVERLNSMFRVSDSQINPVKHPLNPEQPGARLYILEHCKHCIEYFRNQTWRQDKGGELVVKKNRKGNIEKTLKDIPNEPFDTITYPIDTYFFGIDKNSGKPYRQIIEDIWKDPRYKNIQEKKKPKQFTPLTVVSFNGKGFSLNSNMYRSPRF